MKKFKNPFSSIEKLWKIKELKSLVDFSKTQKALNVSVEENKMLDREKQKQIKQTNKVFDFPFKAPIYETIDNYLFGLKKKKEDLKERINQEVVEFKKKYVAYMKNRHKRKIFETLRENLFCQYYKKVKRSEQKRLDDFVSTRYAWKRVIKREDLFVGGEKK